MTLSSAPGLNFNEDLTPNITLENHIYGGWGEINYLMKVNRKIRSNRFKVKYKTLEFC